MVAASSCQPRACNGGDARSSLRENVPPPDRKAAGNGRHLPAFGYRSSGGHVSMFHLTSKAAAAAALLSLAAAPALAAQSAASQLSITRAATPAKKASNAGAPPIIAVIGLIAIVGGGIYFAVDGDNPDSP
jgi:hypothetical protein